MKNASHGRRFSRGALVGLSLLVLVALGVLASRNERVVISDVETSPATANREVPNVENAGPDRRPAGEAQLPTEIDPAREKTYRKFSNLYGGKSPLIAPLFDWAILGFRTDRGSAEYASERQKLFSRLNEDPAATLELLSSAQSAFPEDWGVVRNAVVNLAGHLDVSNAAKSEFFQGEITRPARLTDERGEADPDSLSLGTAIDYLSRVGTDRDATRVLQSVLEKRDSISMAQRTFIVTRMRAYFPAATEPFLRDLSRE